MNIFFDKKNNKPVFWTFQVSGWLGFMYFDIIANSAKLSIVWIITHFIGFSIAVLLRYFYRYLFIKAINLFYKIFIIIFLSLFCGILWYFIGNIIVAVFVNHFSDSFWSIFHISRSVLNYTTPYFGWSTGYWGLKYYFNYIDERSKMDRMLLLSKNAQLQMLRYQINPHFLFNSLNSIQALMYKDVKRADLMLTELSEFLRYTLRFNNNIFISLKDEFEIIEKYLFVEKIRFSENLEYSIHLPENLNNQKILCFLTQPFVENAINHGMKSNPYSKNQVKIEASKIDNWLVIGIYNTGTWKNDKGNEGMGITNVKERLTNAYPNSHSLKIDHDGSMVKVEIKIPYHE
jgi:two-component system LytT family sensor kinase